MLCPARRAHSAGSTPEANQNEKKSKVLKADPALHKAAPNNVVSINVAARWLGFQGASAIRKYRQSNPGYFPCCS
ncbi:hypothetical protein ACIQAD_34435 [Streptomyces sp. NPDC088551]|uniref:hypothetical protein n=1 Tax=unclassified Streptomyces TaxID=2593676 RepID=UPI0038013BBF